MASNGDHSFMQQFGCALSLKDLEDGKFLDGDAGISLTPPEDFDMAKFHRGRLFFRDYLFSCSTVMFFSLVIGMSIPDFLDALVFTEASDTPEKALKRYTMTFHHVALWHYGNIWEENSRAQKSIYNVKAMHKSVREQIQAANIGESRKFLSQYDMGITQSGFIGGIIMYPEDAGISCSIADLDDYVYFWYGIGHALGIQKKYNICAHGLSQTLTFCKQIEHDIIIKNLANPSLNFEKMTNAVITGFRGGKGLLNIITFPVILALSYELTHNKSSRLSIGDTFRFLIWKLLFFTVRHFSWFRIFINRRIENMFHLVFTE